MNTALVDEIVNAVLYEGLILYPYRPSSTKNRRERFTFGRVYPEFYSLAQNGAEPCVIQTECLVATLNESATLTVGVRFLQPVAREVLEARGTAENNTESAFHSVPELRIGDSVFQTWHEAIERRVDVPVLKLSALTSSWRSVPFQFASAERWEPLNDGQKTVGAIVRRQAELRGIVQLGVVPTSPSLFKVTVRIFNQAPIPATEFGDPDSVLLRTFAATHTLLNVEGGSFVSLTEPEDEYREAAATCKNIGTWPVLVGSRETLLSSPIILYDYPKVAPESPGSLFDGTEIDEILTLRIRTMTDAEKLEMRNVDEHARRLLERTEGLSEQSLLKMHGAMRPIDRTNSEPAPASAQPSSAVEFDDFFGTSTPLQGVSVAGVFLKPGDRVRVRPKGRADIMDISLSGQTAVVEAVEQDLSHRIHLAVVFDKDPGKDLGFMRQPGHRFFYGVDEVEPVGSEVI